jgi:hypothetical protein
MVQAIDEEFRATESYKSMLTAALEAYPTLTPALFDMALGAHFANPLAYRKAKKKHYVPPPPPERPESLVLNTMSVLPPGTFPKSVVQEIECEDCTPMADTAVGVNVPISVTENNSNLSSSELTEV